MKLKINLKSVFLAIMLSASLIMPLAAGATANDAGLVPCGNNDSNTAATPASFQQNTCHLGDLFKLIARVTNFLIAASGLYAIFKIIQSSITLVIAAGNEESIKSGRTGIEHALTGLILVFLAYLLVNTIFGVFAPKVGGQSGFLYNPFQ